MIKISRAVLPANTGELVIEALAPHIKGLKFGLNRKKTGLNFSDAQGLVFFARFSKAVVEFLKDGTLSVEQLLAKGQLSQYEWEGTTRYTIAMPEELRGTGAVVDVDAAIKAAKPIVKKAASIETISAMLTA